MKPLKGIIHMTRLEKGEKPVSELWQKNKALFWTIVITFVVAVVVTLRVVGSKGYSAEPTDAEASWGPEAPGASGAQAKPAVHKPLPPAVQEFRSELTAAVAKDSALEVGRLAAGIQPLERALKLRVQQARKDHHLDEWFLRDPDAVFYLDDWGELTSRRHTGETIQALTKWLDAVSDGEVASSPAGLRQIVRDARRKAEAMRDRLQELHERLSVIMNLATPRKAASGTEPAKLTRVREGMPISYDTHAAPPGVFLTAGRHTETVRDEVQEELRLPRSQSDTERLLDQYRGR
jgi:hypothetical protein